MKRKTIFIGILLLVISLFCHCIQEDNFPVLSGLYLGEEPQGLTVKLFAPAIVSTNMNEDGGLIFTPDGKYLFFSSDRPVEINYGYSKQRKNTDETKALHEFYYLPKYGGDIYWLDVKIIEALRPKG